jgi:sulfide dehydrogenase cytochrome subunit
MHLRQFLALTAAVAATGIAPVAGAENLIGKRLAATCASCHGTDGVTTGGALPSLAGQPKDALIHNMKAFKAGTRPATIMHQISKGYTDEQIEAIAAYFAARKN